MTDPTVNTQGNQREVFLDIPIYLKLLEALEMLIFINAEEVTDEENDVPLAELLEQVATEKKRMTFTYDDKVFLAVVPQEDIKVIEKIEEFIEFANIEDALNEDGESLTSKQIDEILRW
jgi:saccharopine dehydrogenase-like NADP-dependent oxidoreductase